MSSRSSNYLPGPCKARMQTHKYGRGFRAKNGHKQTSLPWKPKKTFQKRPEYIYFSKEKWKNSFFPVNYNSCRAKLRCLKKYDIFMKFWLSSHNLRDKLDITEVIDIFTCEDIVSFLSICYHSLYHWLLYNNNAAEGESNVKYANSYPMNWTVKNWFAQDIFESLW